MPKTVGSLMGVFIGDALGLPLECSSPDDARRNHGYVDDYVSNQHHPYSSVAKNKKGTWSDDTQLTLALMRSLARRGQYDLKDIRLSHLEAYQGKWGKPVGWGRSTRQACENIKNGISPTYVADGAGNGPCMKIAPLAIYYVYRAESVIGRYNNSLNASLFKKCKEIAMITHGDQRCIVAAYCQARMVIRAMLDQIPDRPGLISQIFVQDARYAESRIDWPDDTDLLSERIEQITTLDYETETSAISKAICTAQSSFIMNSYPLVAYCVCKYLPYRNFRYAVSQTINAGADADSNGSMVAAIIGANLGFGSIPPEWVKNIRQSKMLLQQVRGFEQAISVDISEK